MNLVLRILNAICVQKYEKNGLSFFGCKRDVVGELSAKTINSEHYCNFFDQIDGKIREKRPDLQKKKQVFSHFSKNYR